MKKYIDERFGEERALYFACDAQGIILPAGDTIRKLISESTAVPFENIFIHATHTHCSAYIQEIPTKNDIEIAYTARLHRTFVDTARAALADLKPTTIKIARGEAKDVGFIRCYELADGSIKTNPGWWRTDIVKPFGTQDDSLQIIRLLREEAKEILIVNFGTHPDTLGGTKYFRDWPGYVVEFTNSALENKVNTLVINGCQGNSNHYNKMRGVDYDVKGVDKAKRMARIITGEVLKIYDAAEEVSTGKIQGFCEISKVGQNPCEPGEIELAKEDKNIELMEDIYVEVVLGEDYLNGIEEYDLIIKAPGISLKDVDGMQLLQAIAVKKELVTQLNEEAKAKGLLLTAVRVECYPDYNLLQDWQKRLSLSKSTLYKWGTVLSLSVAMLLCVGSIWYKSVWTTKLQVSQQKLEEMANWQKRYDKHSANQKRIETLEKSIKEYSRKRILWSEVLPILGACTPKNCWLTQIKQREENNLLELQGRASNMQEVQGLLEKLQATNKFKDIKLLETMEVKGGLLGYKILLQGRDEAK